MAAAIKVLFVVTIAVVLGNVAADPDMLQDFCVADLNSTVKLNGYACKCTNATAGDFYSDVIAKPGLTNTSLGSVVTAANVQKIPGLNTLGLSLSRIDYAPGGLNPLHVHPRANEIIFVLEGELEVAFISTTNQLFAKSIKKGDVFVFPRGLLHYQKNAGKGPASVLAAFNSQTPGTQTIGATLFSPATAVPVDVLARTFQVNTKEVDEIKAKFAPKK